MKCHAKTKAGKPCAANAVSDSQFCFTHDPKRSRERAVAHKLGGQRTRIPHAANDPALPAKVRTSNEVMQVIDYVLAELLVHENSIVRARALIATAHAYAEVIKLEIIEEEVRNQGDRIAAIEAALKQTGRLA